MLFSPHNLTGIDIGTLFQHGRWVNEDDALLKEIASDRQITDELTESTRTDSRTLPTIVRLWPALALLPICVQLFVSLHHLNRGWDDAAITTAFSQTWAQTGRIALTPTSPVVEGYSSFSWFLLLAVSYLFTPSPDAAIAWMKILSAVFFLFSLRLVYLIALREFETRVAAATSVLLLAFCYTPLQEIISGMEMNFAAFLLLLAFHLLTRPEARGRWVLASAVGLLMLATRFEMPYMLVFLLYGLLGVRSRRRPGAPSVRSVIFFGLFLLLGFALLGLWRHHNFGLWMPNTVYAKRFVPYRDWSSKRSFLLTRWAASLEIVYVVGIPILIAALALAGTLRRKAMSTGRLLQIHNGIWSMALGCLLFGIIFGQNWGYPGRMVAAMLPFLILATVGLCISVTPTEFAKRGILGVLIASQILFWIFFTVHPPIEVTPISIVEPLGKGADELRVALHRDHLTVLIADVGASALYHKQLTVLDSGLLTNPTLAQTGWTGFASYFRQTAPDVVETHSIWAQEAHLYSEGLLDGYSIVAANGIRFFVRNDLYEQLRAQRPKSITATSLEPACMQISPVDRQFSLQKQTCLVLNDPGANNNLP